MRTQYQIHRGKTIINLLTAAQQLLDVIHTGEVFADDPKRQQRAVMAADMLESCIAVAKGDMLASTVGNESPFALHRETILGHYGTARKLQDLTLHLWNSGNPFRLPDLFGFADERHTRIGLDLIAGYVNHSENDPAFMHLADEIRDLRAAEKAREAERALETADGYH